MAGGGRNLFRYFLWVFLLWTANASRVHSRLLSAWLIHAIGNTFTLLLPELYAGLARTFRLDRLARQAPGSNLAVVHGIMSELVRDNPRYVEYVTPVAAAYILAHPKWNMYKSEWAKRQLGGMGLDSLPHGWTAFALVSMVYDALGTLRRHSPRRTAWQRGAAQAWERADLIAGAVLGAATALYEGGEFLIHQSEMHAVHNDPKKVAMEWSPQDTFWDIISNLVGGGLAMAVHHRKTPESLPRTSGRSK